MPRTQRPKADRHTLGLFLTEAGKLPPFAQRRLEDLLYRNQNGQLTAEEEREMREAVQYIERKTLLMLDGGVSKRSPCHDKHAQRC